MILSLFSSLNKGTSSIRKNLRSRRGFSLILSSVLLLAIIFSILPGRSNADSDSIVFLKGLFVKEVRGYGLYAEEENARFEKGSKATVYLEVDNFQLGVKDDQYHISISLDLLVKDEDGKVVAEDKKVMTHEYFLKSKIRDVWFTVIMDLSEWPEGKHVLSFVATDNTSGKHCTKEMKIEIY